MRASADRGSILTSRWRQSGVCEKISSFRSSGFNVQSSAPQRSHIVRCTLSAAASSSTRLASQVPAPTPPPRAAHAARASSSAQLLRLPSHGPTHLHGRAPALAACTCMPAAAAAPPPASASVASRAHAALVACQCLCGQPHVLGTGRLPVPLWPAARAQHWSTDTASVASRT